MTEQMTDVIRWRGRKHNLCSLPLEVLFQSWAERPPLQMLHTANYRGYEATWRIVHRKLYLVSFNPNLDPHGPPGKITRRPAFSRRARLTHERMVRRLDELTGGRMVCVPLKPLVIHEYEGIYEHDAGEMVSLQMLLNANREPVFAHWYTGLLRLQDGEEVGFMFDLFTTFRRLTERDVVIEIRGGVVQRHWIVDNVEIEKQRRMAESSLFGVYPHLAHGASENARSILNNPLQPWRRWKHMLYEGCRSASLRGSPFPVLQAVLVLIRTQLAGVVGQSGVLSEADELARHEYEMACYRLAAGQTAQREAKGAQLGVPDDPSLGVAWALHVLQSAEQHIKDREFVLLGAAAEVLQPGSRSARGAGNS